MELSSLELAQEPQRLKIKHPLTGKDTDIVILVISPDHPDFKNRSVEIARAAVKGVEKPTIAAFADRKADFVAALITGWEGISMNGKPFKYSAANLKKLVVDFPWIADQVDSFCVDRRNFFKGSKTA